MSCTKKIINDYNTNPESINQISNAGFRIEKYPEMNIKFAVNGSTLSLYLIEQSHVNDTRAFYFPKTEMLLSIDLKKSKTHLKNMELVQQSQLQTKLSTLQYSADILPDLVTILNYDHGKWWQRDLGNYVYSYFINNIDSFLLENDSTRFTELNNKLKIAKKYDPTYILHTSLFFMQHDDKSKDKKSFIEAVKRLSKHDIFSTEDHRFDDILEEIVKVYANNDTDQDADQECNITSFFKKIVIVNQEQDGESLIF